MKRKLKIVLCCSMDKDLLQQMEKIKSYCFNDDSEIYLVHVYPTHVYTDGFNSYIFPVLEERQKIADSTKMFLREWRDKALSQYQNTIVECLFAPHPKREMVEYLKKIQADLVATATRGKHGFKGLFLSSFTDHLIKFAPSDVLVLRP